MPRGAIGKARGFENYLRGTPLCLSRPQRRKNVHLALEVLYTPGIGRESRERFEPSAALRATPEMADDLPIHVLSAAAP
jgi:hypothetical protein